MYYEINVSLNGIHFFATDKRSIPTREKLEQVYKVLKEKFPEEEGYKLNVSFWEEIGHTIDMDNIDK